MVGSMADLPAFAGVLKGAPLGVTQACVTLQKSFRGYADRSAAVVLADLGRCGDGDFKLIRKTIERRRPFDLAGPDVDEARGHASCAASVASDWSFEEVTFEEGCESISSSRRLSRYEGGGVARIWRAQRSKRHARCSVGLYWDQANLRQCFCTLGHLATGSEPPVTS